MTSLSSHLSILQLLNLPSETELKAAYRRQLRIWHPDLHHTDPTMYAKATEHAKAINAAYEYLSEWLENGAHQTQEPEFTRPSASSYQPRHTYHKRTFTPGFPDPDIFEIFLKSSHIISTGYDRRTSVLYIKFDDNSVYCYFDVPEPIFAEFLEAESHGKFAHRHIYRRYRQRRF